MDNFSFFEMPEKFKDKVLNLNEKTYGNEIINIEIAKQSESRGRNFQAGSRSGGGRNGGGRSGGGRRSSDGSRGARRR